jgi:hypothetical protein
MLSDEELTRAFTDGDELSLATFPTLGPAIRRVEQAVLREVYRRLGGSLDTDEQAC